MLVNQLVKKYGISRATAYRIKNRFENNAIAEHNKDLLIMLNKIYDKLDNLETRIQNIERNIKNATQVETGCTPKSLELATFVSNKTETKKEPKKSKMKPKKIAPFKQIGGFVFEAKKDVPTGNTQTDFLDLNANQNNQTDFTNEGSNQNTQTDLIEIDWNQNNQTDLYQVFPQDFIDFWQAYPPKPTCSQTRAYAAFQIAKRKNGFTQDNLIKATSHYALVTKDIEFRFIKNPDTFLDEEMWRQKELINGEVPITKEEQQKRDLQQLLYEEAQENYLNFKNNIKKL